MQTVLDHKLLVITGKGGVGKTTIAAATGLLAAQGGRRVIVVEVGQEERLPALFGIASSKPGVETQLQEDLWSISIDPDRALLEWLQALGGRVSGRVLASSGTFQYFTAAAPGAKELVAMVKIWRLTRGADRGRRAQGYDLVVLDAPATGHALGMLRSPQTFGAIARVGPIAGQTREVQQLLETPSHTAYVAVALPTEMAVTEVLEIQEGLHRQLGRELSAVVVNALLPRRFTTQEMGQIESLAQVTSTAANIQESAAVVPSDLAGRQTVTQAIGAARAIHDRARFQHNQLARLRRRNLDVIGIPFVWDAQLDLAAVSDIAKRLERAL